MHVQMHDSWLTDRYDRYDRIRTVLLQLTMTSLFFSLAKLASAFDIEDELNKAGLDGVGGIAQLGNVILDSCLVSSWKIQAKSNLQLVDNALSCTEEALDGIINCVTWRRWCSCTSSCCVDTKLLPA